jgi:hypothetical protein
MQEEKPLTNKSLLDALAHYRFMLEVLVKILSSIERKNIDSINWTTLSEKIGRKYFLQATTLQQIFANDLWLRENKDENRFLDFSSVYSLLRVQTETYAVFYHLFVDKCSADERLVRFRLWELDGLRLRHGYAPPEDDEINAMLSVELEYLRNMPGLIAQNSFFKQLDKNQQTYLLSKALWRFSSESLKNKEKRHWKLSIEKMILNTGIKQTIFSDWYAFTSTHAHTTYLSVVQTSSVSPDDIRMLGYVAIKQASFISSFMIKDFCSIYKVAKETFNSLTDHEKKVVDSYNNGGRNH